MAVPTLRQKKLAREQERQAQGLEPRAIGYADDIAQELSRKSVQIADQFQMDKVEELYAFWNLCKHIDIGSFQCHIRHNPHVMRYELWLGYAPDSALKQGETE